MSVIEKENAINAKYDKLKAEIEAKEITAGYTQADKNKEIAAIESKEITDEYTQEDKDNEIAAIKAKPLITAYTKEDKQNELAENEANREAELKKVDDDFENQLNNMLNKGSSGFSNDYINTVIENLDFSTPDPVEIDNDTIESTMYSLAQIADNCKYIYLTMPSKYDALNELSENEYSKYASAYDSINTKYDELKASISAKQLITPYTQTDKDNEIAAIEAKEITEEYTQEDKDNEIAAIKAKELIEGYTQTNKDNELSENETARDAEIKTLNEEYLNTMTTIGISLTALKTDKETGFSGDVHVNGKLHVDEDVNLEGKLNNIAIEDILTQDHLTTINNSIAQKANSIHKHKISDIEDYKAYDDSEIRTLITNRPQIYNVETFDEVKTNWRSYANNSFISITEGPVDLSSSIIFKQNYYRALILSLNKYESGYIYTRFVGADWKDESGWRKIPVMDASSNMKIDGNITATNIKANNETRLVATETNITTLQNNINTINNSLTNMQTSLAAKADSSHTHKLADIEDYKEPEAYDDTEIRELINTNTTNISNKADSTHKHKLADIEDYKEAEAYDDTSIKADIANNTTKITNIETNINTINNSLTNMQTSIASKADSSHTHTSINNDLSINGNVNIKYYLSTDTNVATRFNSYIWGVKFFDSILADNQNYTIGFGRKQSSKECGMLCFNYGVKNGVADPCVGLRLHSSNGIYIYADRITTSVPLTASNIKSDNETRLAATETNIAILQNTVNEHTTQIANKADSTHNHSVEDITGLGEVITNINSKLNTNETNIANNKSSISQLETDIAFNYSELEQYKTSNAKALTDFKEEFQTTIGDIDSRLTSAETSIDNKADLEHKHKMQDIEDYKSVLLDFIYPIGSIYTSMSNTSPATLFGGTWKQIIDRFLYCSNSSKISGGSKTITVDNLPAHTHDFVVAYLTSVDKDGNPDGAADSGNNRGYWRYGSEFAKSGGQTDSTGSGTDYMPPYITVFAWYRTA